MTARHHVSNMKQLIDDWYDSTTLDEEKKGHSLKTIRNSIYPKQMFDRNRPTARDGVEHFRKRLRPFFVKGAQYIFLWRFLGLFKAGKVTTTSSPALPTLKQPAEAAHLVDGPSSCSVQDRSARRARSCPQAGSGLHTPCPENREAYAANPCGRRIERKHTADQ